MDKNNDTESQSRGVIIIDTSCLINMCKIPKLSRKKDSFLDSLGYLAQHGFTIVIPEFVVIEATNKCPTRELEALLKKLNATPNHAEDRGKFLNFLEKYKDLLVVEKAKPKTYSGNALPYFGICELVREAVEMAQPGYSDTHPLPNNYNKDPQKYWEARVKSNIRSAMNAAYQYGDLGEAHCFRVMLDRIIEGNIKNYYTPQAPIYFLCDDTISNKGMHEIFVIPAKDNLIKHMKNPPTLNFLTMAGFFRALGDKGKKGKRVSLLERMDFLEKPEDILHIMYEKDKKYYGAWNSSMRDRTVLSSDSLPPPYPFRTAINDLRRDLEYAEAQGSNVASMVSRISGAGQQTEANHPRR